jgi:hypothetical protein
MKMIARMVKKSWKIPHRHTKGETLKKTSRTMIKQIKGMALEDIKTNMKTKTKTKKCEIPRIKRRRRC